MAAATEACVWADEVLVAATVLVDCVAELLLVDWLADVAARLVLVDALVDCALETGVVLVVACFNVGVDDWLALATALVAELAVAVLDSEVVDELCRCCCWLAAACCWARICA